MINLCKKETRWFALLSVGAALVFLSCHTLGAKAHTIHGSEPFQTAAAAPIIVDSHGTAAHTENLGCEVALAGAFAPVLKGPPISTDVPATAFLPPPLLVPPAREVSRAAPTVMAPYRTSLHRQAVLFRV